MSKPILTYFDFPGGRGEASRLAFHLAGAEWTDERFKGDWPAKKGTTPFGAMPTLTVEGKPVLSQSNAILGYIGRRHGLLPEDEWEAARHVSIMNATEELRAEAAATSRDDKDAKRAARQAFASGYLTRWVSNLSEQVIGPFLGGETLSVADLKLFVMLRAYRNGVFDHVPATILDGYPKIIGLYDAVAAHPKVADWVAKF